MVEDFSQAFFSGYKSLKIFHNSWKFLIANSKMIKFRFWWCNFIKIELDNTSIKTIKFKWKIFYFQIPKSDKWHTWKMRNRKIFQDAPKNSHKRTSNFFLENVLRDTLIFSAFTSPLDIIRVRHKLIRVTLYFLKDLISKKFWIFRG